MKLKTVHTTGTKSFARIREEEVNFYDFLFEAKNTGCSFYLFVFTDFRHLTLYSFIYFFLV